MAMYHAKTGKLFISESEGNNRAEFRLLIGEITDALNYREFEVVIKGRREIDLEKDLARFIGRVNDFSITLSPTS